jgi:hypothetical protein
MLYTKDQNDRLSNPLRKADNFNPCLAVKAFCVINDIKRAKNRSNVQFVVSKEVCVIGNGIRCKIAVQAVVYVQYCFLQTSM